MILQSPMTLTELHERASALAQQILQLNDEMDRIHDEEKLVAHSRRILALQNEFEAVQEQINQGN